MSLYVFGDSHASFNMKNAPIEHINCYQNSITMHRIGRNEGIVNFNPNCNSADNVFLFFYGEVDCRCHIKRQIDLGRKLEDVVEELVSSYFKTISKNIVLYKKIIIGSITPPLCKEKYERQHGPITHDFPMVGTDAERSQFTILMNAKISEYCKKFGYDFLDVYDHYVDRDGLLIYEKSDTNCHITDNTYIHEQLKLLL